MKRNNNWVYFFSFSIILLVSFTLYSQSQPANFISDAKFIYSAVACGSNDMVNNAAQNVVNEHCKRLKKKFTKYKNNFLNKAIPFFKEIRPGELSDKVVYPFGGNDLFSALVYYPEAREITTISLEGAGDPRKVRNIRNKKMRIELTEFRRLIDFIVSFNCSSNDSARSAERGILPGQLSFSLAAGVVFDYVPVSLRYFRLEKNGSLHYYTLEEINNNKQKYGKKLKYSWVDTDFSPVFRNMELVLQKKDGNGKIKRIIHRHIAANLDNKHFNNSPLQKHLMRKGRISAMTKAASYLLWFDNFTGIRNYLLNNMDCMISDATGILPRHARRAGSRQVTYGRFNGAFLPDHGGAMAGEMRLLWRSQPFRPMPFNNGCSDVKGSSHLLITSPMKKK